MVGVIPNFYGFLNNMGVGAPEGVTKFYYFAYWVGLFVAGLVYYVLCKIFPVPIQYDKGWHEPKNYIRPEEEGQVAEGESVNILEETSSETEGAEKVVRETVTDVKE